MQYVGRAFDSVSKTWSSINPSTLSGAIDVIVVENESGELSCSPFHVRFGKFQLLRPSQKKVDFIINGKLTNLPMKLGDGGEAFFVFEMSKNADIPEELITSPVLSAASSPGSSPPGSPTPGNRLDYTANRSRAASFQEPEYLDISQSNPELSRTDHDELPSSSLSQSDPSLIIPPGTPQDDAKSEKLKKLSRKLTRINIPIRLDDNGDLLLDMNGYKSNDQNTHNSDEVLKKLLSEEFGDDVDLKQFVQEDDEGNIKIISNEDLSKHKLLGQIEPDVGTPGEPATPTPTNTGTTDSYESEYESEDLNSSSVSSTNYVKTLRLTSDQLKFLDLKEGENDLQFSVDKGKAVITSKLFLWSQKTPIVISDIDGTITKSDALGHVLTMIGRDWTHPGVAQLFQDIAMNGFNIMYLTARSVGQADSTRSYLRSIDQNGIGLPVGPVILSPDRTMAALKREVILKKPEVFKMSCLNDLKNLYQLVDKPFYAGFGNRITDALSYRSVGIPSSRIFTINPDGEVHMELLELAGYKSSYVFINELVDHFFPPVHQASNDEGYTDVNFWRDPLPELSDDDEDVDVPDKDTQTNSSMYQSSFRLTLDDFDRDYDEDEDADYVEAEDDDYGDEDDVDEDHDNEYYDDDADTNETLGSEDGSYSNDLDEEDDLDRDLLEETDEENYSESRTSPSISNRGFVPMGRNNSGTSLTSKNVDGNIIKASELMKDMKIEENS